MKIYVHENITQESRTVWTLEGKDFDETKIALSDTWQESENTHISI